MCVCVRACTRILNVVLIGKLDVNKTYQDGQGVLSLTLEQCAGVSAYSQVHR